MLKGWKRLGLKERWEHRSDTESSKQSDAGMKPVVAYVVSLPSARNITICINEIRVILIMATGDKTPPRQFPSTPKSCG